MFLFSSSSTPAPPPSLLFFTLLLLHNQRVRRPRTRWPRAVHAPLLFLSSRRKKHHSITQHVNLSLSLHSVLNDSTMRLSLASSAANALVGVDTNTANTLPPFRVTDAKYTESGPATS